MTGPGRAPRHDAPQQDTAGRPDVELDCLGRPCPVPVLELARALLALPAGAVAQVLSDDPAALVDVPAFCRMRGHTYLGALPRPVGTALRVRREGGPGTSGR